MVWTRTGHRRYMCCWKPVVYPADLLTALCWGWTGSPMFLSTVQAATALTRLCTRWNLCYAKFRRRLHSENLSLSTIHPPDEGSDLVWRMIWLRSHTVGDGKRREARTGLCGIVTWPPAKRAVRVGSLANSFLAEFCTLERIVFSNSSIQRGGTILKFA